MDRVRYVGEPVAAVAAEDEHTAEAALALIDVDYEELPSALGMEAALAPGAPLIHDDAPGNVCAHERVEQGDIAQGFAASDRIFEAPYTFPMVYHYSMEPHAAVARYGADGIDLWSSAQHPFLVQQDIARIFGMTRSQVRLRVSLSGRGLRRQVLQQVRAPGGAALAQGGVSRAGLSVGFRSHGDGAAARRHREPQDRGEERRHPGGAAGGRSISTPGRSPRTPGWWRSLPPPGWLGPYRIPHLRSDVYSVHTNAGSAGSFRSVAAPQTIFACESQMDEIAAELGMDPVELRGMNLLKRGETLQPKLRPVDVNLHSSLRRLVSASRWRRRSRAREGAAGACLRLHQRRGPVAGVRGAGASGARRPCLGAGGEHGNGPGSQDGVHPDRGRGAGVAA